MQNVRPTMPLIVKAIGMSGIFGVSMIISLSSDLLAFMTLHVYWFYMVAARIFNWQFTILYSLFNLFRGKDHKSIYDDNTIVYSWIFQGKNAIYCAIVLTRVITTWINYY